MTKLILSTAAALLVTATAAHGAPVNSDTTDLNSMSAIQTSPLTQTTHDEVYSPDFDDGEMSRAGGEENYDDSPITVKGFWKTGS